MEAYGVLSGMMVRVRPDEIMTIRAPSLMSGRSFCVRKNTQENVVRLVGPDEIASNLNSTPDGVGSSKSKARTSFKTSPALVWPHSPHSRFCARFRKISLRQVSRHP